MKRIRPTLAWIAVLVVCEAVALTLPAPSGPANSAYVTILVPAVAVAAAAFGTVVVVIGWRSGAWAPAMLALGCVSMAIGATARFVSGDAGLALAPDASGTLPLIGMLIGGAWFFLCVQPIWPTSEGQASRVHVVMLGGILLAIASVLAIAAYPSIMPDEAALRVVAGVAASGYLVAGWRFASVWRFLRLPSQLTTMAGAFLFAPSVIILAAGGAPGVSPWQLELFMLATAALPVSGFIIEQRARPGLRTMVFGLFFPGAVAEMRRGYPGEMVTLVERIGAYDGPLLGHVDRVADLSVQIAIDLGFDASAIREVMLAGQLHDVGKLFVPREILEKNGALDDREWATVRAHSAQGAVLVARAPAIAVAARAIGEHHERWVGGGYPKGAAGNAISPAARIIAVADVFDALSSTRSYKQAWSAADALAEVERGSGTNFEPRVVDALTRIIGANRQLAA